MKYPLILILPFVFYSCKTPAQTQTWTVNRVRDSVLVQNARIIAQNTSIIAMQAKLAVKDKNDDERNRKIDLLFTETVQLKKANDSLKLQNAAIKKILDNSVVHLRDDQFDIDSITKIATYIDQPDTLLVIRKPTFPKPKSLVINKSKANHYTVTFPQEEAQIIDKKKVGISKSKVKKK